MRTLGIGLLALAGATIATPALAQSFYLGVPGVGVQVGDPYHNHYIDNDAPRYRNYGYDDTRYQTYGHRNNSYDRSGCRTITIQRDDGSVRRIRRCG
jgi:hypothetical protein